MATSKVSKIKIAFIASLLLASQFIFSRPAYAAGSASITVESSANPVTTSQDFTLSFYVTPSGASISSVGFTVDFTKLTFRSYSASGTAFNGTSQVASGGTAGSTSIEIAAAYAGAGSGTGKLLIGRATVRADGSAGTGIVNLGSPQAYDSNLEPMTASAQDGSITINAPASPPATCPAGQTGTPPNCSTPSSPSNNNSTPTQNNSNPDSNVAVPNSDSTDPGADPNIISEEEFTEASNEQNTNTESPQDGDESKSEKKSNTGKFVLIGLGSLTGLGVLALFARGLMKRRRLGALYKGVDLKPSSPQSPVSSNSGSENIIKPTDDNQLPPKV